MRLLTPFRHTLAATALAAGLGLTLTPTAQAEDFGFAFQLGNSASSNVVGTNFNGVRFTATDSITIDTLGFGMNSGSGGVTFALQADDGFGNPSGVDIVAGNTTAAAGFTTATITPTAIVAGTTYHVVARPNGGSAALRLLLGGIGTVADVNTRDGSAAPNSAQVFSSNSGTSWSAFGFDSRTLIWGVSNSTTNQSQGQPYDTGVVTNFGDNILRGQSFTQDTGADKNVASITVSLIRNAGTETIAGDVRVRLINTDTLEDVFTDTLLTAAELAPGGSGFFTLNIDELDRPTLEDGVNYAVMLDSIDSTASGVWRMVTSRAGNGTGDIFTENYQDEDGASVIGVLNTSTGVVTSVSSIDTATLRHDSYFNLDLVPVPEPASLALIGLGSLAMISRRKKK